MGMPMIIGAGIGALGSAAMGKSPFTGALLGGTLGGLGGAGGLFGAGGSGAGVSGLTTAAPAAATAGEIAIPTTSLLGAGTIAPSVGIPASALESGIGMAGLEGGAATAAAPAMGVQLSAAPSLGAMDYSIGAGNTLAGGQSIYQTPSFMDKIKSGSLDLGNQATSWASNNPMSAGKMALDIATPTPQQPVQHQGGGIIRQNFDPSSVLMNTSPTLGLSKDELAKGKVGQIAGMASLSDDDKRRIGDFYTSLIG